MEEITAMKRIVVGLLLIGWLATLSSTALAQRNVPTMNTVQHLIEEGEFDAALDLLEQRVKADRNDVQARFLKAMVLLRQGKKEEAQAVFVDIVRHFPKLPEASNNLAALYANDGEYEKARQALLSAIANVPDYSTAHINLGDLYVKMAIDAYRQAVKLDPNDKAAKAKSKFLEQLFAEEDGSG